MAGSNPDAPRPSGRRHDRVCRRIVAMGVEAGRPAWRDSSRMSEVASAITGIPRRTGGVCLGGGRIGRAKLWRDGSGRGEVAAVLMPVVSAG